ncbi:RHS repeat-associated core domain-containing protein [Streptomyces sp. NPDC059989]|uniref:RHS repeat-associated core domain-containing protein n=1 Tax=Streptomyces sp. NPDC059989 TaxID=3347026 RepID=UPI00369E4666
MVLGLSLTLAVSTVGAVEPTDRGAGRPGVQSSRDLVKGSNGKAKGRPDDAARKAAVRELSKATWPGRGSAEVAVAARGSDARTKAVAGGLPLTVTGPEAAPPKAAGPALSAEARGESLPAKVKVDVLDAAQAAEAGAGALLRVQRADQGQQAAQVRLNVDYSAFAEGYGGGYGSRLRLVQLPACAAVAEPGSAACPELPRPLRTVNNAKERTVSADVTAVPKREGASTMSVSGEPLVALTAGSSSSQGDFGATGLAPSASWSVAQSTGGFSWSYPLRTVPVPGKLAPTVGLSYTSQSIDGRTSATNNQGSWIGEGFGYEPGYIERQYKSCSDDGHEGSAEQCWAHDNATVMLGGNASQIIKDDTTGQWKLSNSDGSKVEKLSGAANGDNDGEYWKITTADGTEYHFGLNRLPGWAAGKEETASVWTAPVFGDDSGEPCYNATFANAHCAQAWRWNLDYVKDPHGNVMSHFYEKETNHYALNGKTDVNGTAYVRAGYLKRIDYGQRDGAVYTEAAPARVLFNVAERCLPTPEFDCAESKRTKANASQWPDTPVDRECKAATKCGADQYSTTFFTTKRLTSVVTQMRKDATQYQDVDAWSFTHLFTDNGDSSKALWLSKIDHEGRIGTAAKVPAVELFGMQFANRVDKDGDNIAPFHRFRLATVLSETGAQLGVNYAPTDCSATALPKPGESTKRCYPVKWAPPGSLEPIDDWFHKYVVAEIIEIDRTGGGENMVTRYDYQGPAGWRHSKPDGITPDKFLTWGDWQGYGKVTVTSGGDDSQRTRVDHTYFQGLNGDRLPAGGTRSAKITDSTGAEYTDDEDYVGFELESATYSGGSVTSKAVHTPWKHATATQTKPWGVTRATLVKPEVTRGFTALGAGAWRETWAKTTYDTASGTGRATEVDDKGWVVPATAPAADVAAAAKDDTCTRTWYADSAARNFLKLVSRTEKVATQCGAATDRKTQVISDDRTLYDNLAFGTAPTRGLPTGIERIASHDGTTAVYQRLADKAYDGYGRVTSATTPAAGTSTTTYTEVNGLTTSLKAVNSANHTMITDYEPAWGQASGQTDANGKRSDIAFDGLGRVVSVWHPDRVKALQTPSSKHSYLVRTDGPLAIKTEKIENDGSYGVEYMLYDSLLRARQKQSEGPGGTRLVADTFYDNRGMLKASYDTYSAAGAPSDQLLVVRNGDVTGQNRYEYDDLGRTVATIFSVAGAEQWRTTTQHEGDRSHVTVPQGGLATTSITDAQGRLTEIRQYNGNVPVLTGPGTPYTSTKYEYGSGDELVKVTDSKGNNWSATYDQRGRKTRTVDPDSGALKLAYDEADRLISTTHEKTGEIVSRAYDGLGRPTFTYDGTPAQGKKVTEQRYDRAGMLGQVYASLRYVDATEYFASVVQTVDDFYRPTKTAYSVPKSQGALAGTYTYTEAYNRDGSAQSSGLPAVGGLAAEVLAYQYDEMQRPVSMKGINTYVTNTVWSPDSQMLQLQLSTGGKKIWQTSEYELGTKRLTRDQVDIEGSTAGPAKRTDYSYDQSGNILSIADTATPATTDVQCFAYDSKRRLAEAWTPHADTTTSRGSGTVGTNNTVIGSTPSACAGAPGTKPLGGPSPYWTSYATDALGNRTSDVSHDVGLNASKNITRSFTYGENGAGPHAVTKVVAKTPTGDRQTSYGYDSAGRMATRTDGGVTHSLAWGSTGGLAKFSSPDDLTTPGKNEAAETTYLYDASGQRVQRKDASGTTVFLPGMELTLAPGATTAKATRYYNYADQTVAVRTSDNKVTFLASDHHGTGELAIDATTGAVVTRRSDPYGNPRGVQPDAGAWPGQRGFVGGTIDASTGLTQLGARQYDAVLGKFISPDPMVDFTDPQQMNAYAYASNSPVTLSDPSGLAPCIDGIRDSCGGCSVFVIGCGGGGGGDDGGSGDDGDDGQEETEAEEEVTTARTHHQSSKKTITKVTEAIIEEVKDIIGVNALMDCASNPAVGICLKAAAEIAMNFGGGALKVLFKAKRVIKAVSLLDDLYSAISKFVKSSDKLSKAEEKLEKVRKANKEKKRKKDKDKEDEECEAHSFLPGTTVLLADGTRKNIEDVALGDKVMSTDPETGAEIARPVVGTIVTEDDKQFVDLTVRKAGAAGSAALVSTVTHPFWVQAENRWVEAGDLKPGMQLSTPDSGDVAVVAVRAFEKRQRTHDLTVDGIHDYYVNAGDIPLLVHNCLVTVYHYTDKKGYNGIRAGNPYHIREGDSKNGAGPFFTPRSPGSLAAGDYKSVLGLTKEKSEYVIEFQIEKSAFTKLRGGRGAHIWTIPKGVMIPRSRVRYIGPTSGWSPPK